jgi:hypothetical protein
MHSNVYKNFKETNSESSQMQLRGEASSIQRVDSERFAKYSKIENPKLVKSSIKCEKLKYEIESPIESIPSEIYPNKKYKIASISSS